MLRYLEICICYNTYQYSYAKRVTGQYKTHKSNCLDRIVSVNHDFVLKLLSEENRDLEC